MTREEIERIVIEQVAYIAQIDVKLDNKLDHLAFNDIDKAEILGAIAGKLNINIDIDELETWQTVRDIVEYVERLV